MNTRKRARKVVTEVTPTTATNSTNSTNLSTLHVKLTFNQWLTLARAAEGRYSTLNTPILSEVRHAN